MDNISSILASFDVNQVTEQYCGDLRRQKEGRLPRKERETLERTIREFRSEDQGTVLGAIVIYAVFCPDEAIHYARQKGVFYYGSAWPHTEYCLEHLNSLFELLHIPQHQQRFFQQKLSCRWLGRFYRETEGSRTVHTCILLGNRLFAVPNGMRHPVRYAYELNMVLTSGTINSNLGHWSCWAGEQFADEDLVRYLSDADPLSKSFLESMKPYTETFCCQGKTMQLNSYTYNSLLHLEKQDEHLRTLDKNEEEWQRLDEQFRIKRE